MLKKNDNGPGFVVVMLPYNACNLTGVTSSAQHTLGPTALQRKQTRYRRHHEDPCHCCRPKRPIYSSSWENPTSELRDFTCHMGSHSVTYHPTQVNAPQLTLAMQAGTRFTYPGGMEDWVDRTDLIAPWILIEILVTYGMTGFQVRAVAKYSPKPVQWSGKSYSKTILYIYFTQKYKLWQHI